MVCHTFFYVLTYFSAVTKWGGCQYVAGHQTGWYKGTFDKHKIALAIEKAEHSSTGLYEEGLAQRIADEIEEYAQKLQKDMTIYAIEDQVYYKLIEYHNPATARAYEGYKAVQAFKRRQNTTDDDVIGLLDRSNVSVLDENSNKECCDCIYTT